ncbi:MAG: recombination-associated protein RdgC [Desulfocapsaceae bacterium]|nr:recombination-associated protein RdgC [Desulfocapsaceae bacterium]
MGFISGSASFVRFGVEGELPENTWDFIAERVAAFSFQDIDDTYDEFSIGWVSVLNMFDADFSYASYANGDYVTLTLRMDERKVSPAILKKFCAKEEERLKKERQLPKISKAMKTEIKERIHTELMRKAVPVPAVYDLCWNLAESTLLFFSTNKKAQAQLEDFFKETFGLTIIQQIPYLIAEHLVDEKQRERLASIGPDIFV